MDQATPFDHLSIEPAVRITGITADEVDRITADPQTYQGAQEGLEL